VTKCSGCGVEVDETKTPEKLADWEQLTVVATRNGGSETLLAVMVCPTDKPKAGAVAILLNPTKLDTSRK